MTLAMAEQKLGQAVAGTQFILFRDLSVPNQIAKRFMVCIGDPDTGGISGTEASDNGFRVTTIGLDPAACFFS